MDRRLPVYILIDTSGSMKGEPIESVRVGLESMLSVLRSDPYALETVNISIITYDKDVKQVLPLTPIDELHMPRIETPDSGPTHMGAALEMVLDKVELEVRKGSYSEKGDWMPLLFLMTDGKPSDRKVFTDAAARARYGVFATVVCCAAGPKARTEDLTLLTDNVYRIDTIDNATLMKFFKWVSGVIGEGNRSMGAKSSIALPPPPEEVNIVL